MGKDAVIKVENVSKKYCKSLKRSMLYGVRDIIRNTLGLSSHSNKLRKDEFWALDDVSFEVKKGETLGIIGPNGAGKTTMLKMLNGIFWPDKGKITVKGRVGALIAVGAGFHPLLTGRENIYINAAILGMTKREVDEKFNDIIEFADIGDFIDTPVKFYSSGMFVRLGFTIALYAKTDILLVDEILSVGDFRFQTKSYSAINNLKRNGVACILVSHNMDKMIEFSDRTMWINKGKIQEIGDSKTVCQNYIDFSVRDIKTTSANAYGGQTGLRDDLCYNLSYKLNGSRPSNTFHPHDSLHLDFSFRLKKKLPKLHISISIYREDGILMSAFDTLFDRLSINSFPDVKGKLTLDDLNLNLGHYKIVFVIMDGIEYIIRQTIFEFNVISTTNLGHGILDLKHKWQF